MDRNSGMQLVGLIDTPVGERRVDRSEPPNAPADASSGLTAPNLNIIKERILSFVFVLKRFKFCALVALRALDIDR